MKSGDSIHIKKKGKKYDPDDFAEKFIEQLRLNKNNITAACKTLKISKETYYNHLKYNPELKNKIDEMSEEMLDFVEGKMFQIIDEMEKGAPGLIMFYLKAKGKHRGYGDDSNGDDSSPSTINIKFE